MMDIELCGLGATVVIWYGSGVFSHALGFIQKMAPLPLNVCMCVYLYLGVYVLLIAMLFCVCVWFCVCVTMLQ